MTHVDALIVMLEDSEWRVRKAAVQVMGKLESAVLASHVDALIAKLDHSDEHVRVAMVHVLGKLESAALAAHVDALIAKLDHSDAGVREAAVATHPSTRTLYSLPVPRLKMAPPHALPRRWLLIALQPVISLSRMVKAALLLT